MGNTTLTETFENISSTTWYLDQYGATVEAGVSDITRSPASPLESGDGEQAYQYEQFAGGIIASGGAGLYCCWNNGTARFGIKIWADVQVLGMGNRPQWYYLSDNTPDSATLNWQLPDSQTAPLTLPGNFGGCKITATPSSTHDSLQVSVVISDQG